VRFVKGHGTGNDFVVLVDPERRLDLTPDLVRRICDRRRGIGGDGVLRAVLSATDPEGAVMSDAARWFMDYRNADGSLAEMCGNGLRCVAVFLRDMGVIAGDTIDVGTRSGVRRTELLPDGRVRVDMGEPNFTKAAIPMRGPAWEHFLEEPLDLGNGVSFRASAVSMGNPHLVLFLDEDPDRYHVGHIGAALERDERFPEGTNVEFAKVAEDGIVARVWERGSGETMACGSGACAIAVAANEAGLVGRRTSVRFPGGTLEVERLETGGVSLTGPAAQVFETTVDVAALLEARAG